jgi:hypothetical protein
VVSHEFPNFITAPDISSENSIILVGYWDGGRARL